MGEKGLTLGIEGLVIGNGFFGFCRVVFQKLSDSDQQDTASSLLAPCLRMLSLCRKRYAFAIRKSTLADTEKALYNRDKQQRRHHYAL